MKINHEARSLYAHFPFCETKCHYCDFFSLPESKVLEGDRLRAYAAISAELRAARHSLTGEIETVFLGGGTPSLVPSEILGEILAQTPKRADAEVTMEANPSSITREKAVSWRAIGVNRVSMGVQSFNDARLRWLGRAHDRQKAVDALEALFSAGFANVSVDYIVGVPGQTAAHVSEEIKEILALFPQIQHVSAYLLTLSAKNKLAHELPPEDDQLAHLGRVRDTLAELGFEQYEISNFARPGRRARHNENYWLGGGYLGVGPSAHSFDPATSRRWKNWASLGKYAEIVESGQAPVEWTETLTREQERMEYLMLRLRRRDGIDLAEYRAAFGQDLRHEKSATIEEWARRDLCELSDRLRLTGSGFFLSDKIISSLI